MNNIICTPSEFIRFCILDRDMIKKDGDRLTILLPTRKPSTLELNFTERGISAVCKGHLKNTRKAINSILNGASYSDLITVPYIVQKHSNKLKYSNNCEVAL